MNYLKTQKQLETKLMMGDYDKDPKVKLRASIILVIIERILEVKEWQNYFSPISIRELKDIDAEAIV